MRFLNRGGSLDLKRRDTASTPNKLTISAPQRVQHVASASDSYTLPNWHRHRHEVRATGSLKSKLSRAFSISSRREPATLPRFSSPSEFGTPTTIARASESWPTDEFVRVVHIERSQHSPPPGSVDIVRTVRSDRCTTAPPAAPSLPSSYDAFFDTSGVRLGDRRRREMAPSPSRSMPGRMMPSSSAGTLPAPPSLASLRIEASRRAHLRHQSMPAADELLDRPLPPLPPITPVSPLFSRTHRERTVRVKRLTPLSSSTPPCVTSTLGDSPFLPVHRPRTPLSLSPLSHSNIPASHHPSSTGRSASSLSSAPRFKIRRKPPPSLLDEGPELRDLCSTRTSVDGYVVHSDDTKGAILDCGTDATNSSASYDSESTKTEAMDKNIDTKHQGANLHPPAAWSVAPSSANQDRSSSGSTFQRELDTLFDELLDQCRGRHGRSASISTAMTEPSLSQLRRMPAIRKTSRGSASPPRNEIVEVADEHSPSSEDAESETELETHRTDAGGSITPNNATELEPEPDANATDDIQIAANRANRLPTASIRKRHSHCRPCVSDIPTFFSSGRTDSVRIRAPPVRSVAAAITPPAGRVKTAVREIERINASGSNTSAPPTPTPSTPVAKLRSILDKTPQVSSTELTLESKRMMAEARRRRHSIAR